MNAQNVVNTITNIINWYDNFIKNNSKISNILFNKNGFYLFFKGILIHNLCRIKKKT